MRVLFVHEAISPIGGGSQKTVFTWIRNLKKMGIKVKLLCNQPSKHHAFEDLSNNNLIIINKIINLSLIYPHFSISPFLLPKTINLIKQFNPQLIHLNESFFISKQIYKLAQSLKIKTLASFHTDFSNSQVNRFPLSLLFKKNSWFSRLIDKIQLIFLKQADFITAPSKFYQKILTTKLRKKVFCLPSPIPDYFFQKRSDFLVKNVNKLITVSRISGEKNINLLIDMMSYLKNQFTLTIVGEGIDRPILEAKVKKLKLDKVIKFTGWVKGKKLAFLLKNHHLFVSASAAETFGIAYVEALACALPCLVFDCPVTKEIIPKSMAIFVNKLEPVFWAQKLQQIQENISIFRRLKENIYKNFDKLSPYHEKNSTHRLIEIYKQII